MSSRENILNEVKKNQPSLLPLPGERTSGQQATIERFKEVLESIGGKAEFCAGLVEAGERIVQLFPDAKRIVSSVTEVERYFLKHHEELQHHSLHDADVVILEAAFGVAENGAVWVTEEDTKIRVLPFIGEHLVMILRKERIVATMHDAYNSIGYQDYRFGVFIAGPSKTADIEQSLVLGAHGPKSMTIMIIP